MGRYKNLRQKVRKLTKWVSVVTGVAVVSARLTLYYQNGKEKSIKNAVMRYVQEEIYEDQIKPLLDLSQVIRKDKQKEKLEEKLKKEIEYFAPTIKDKIVKNISWREYIKLIFGDEQDKNEIVKKLLSNNYEDEISRRYATSAKDGIRKEEIKYLEQVKEKLKKVCQDKSLEETERFARYNEILVRKVWTPNYFGMSSAEIEDFVERAISEYRSGNCFD